MKYNSRKKNNHKYHNRSSYDYYALKSDFGSRDREMLPSYRKIRYIRKTKIHHHLSHTNNDLIEYIFSKNKNFVQKNKHIGNNKKMNESERYINQLKIKIMNMPNITVKNIPSTTVIMTRVCCYTTEEDIRELLAFRNITVPIKNINVLIDDMTGLCKGICFLNTITIKHAETIIDELQNETIKEEPFYLNYK